MRPWLVLLIACALPSAALAAPSCSPKDNTARVLTAPSPNAIHPDWQGESSLGLSWSLVSVGAPIRNAAGAFLKGDLVSPRGGVVNRGIYVVAQEWDCSP